MDNEFWSKLSREFKIFLNEIPPLSVFIGGFVIIAALILKSFDKIKAQQN